MIGYILYLHRERKGFMETSQKRIPKKKTFLTIIALFIFMTFASFAALANSSKITVEVPVLNVRTGPGLSHDVTTQVYEDQELNVLEEKDQWYKVRLSNDQIGWIASWLVEEQEVTTESQRFGRITAPSVNVRQFATTDSSVLNTVNQDAQLQVLFQQGEWTQIQYNDQVGWVHSDYIQLMNSSDQSVNVESGHEVTIGNTETNVRSQATINSNIITTASAGTTYPYLGTENGWHMIQMNDGSTGYVSGEWTQINPVTTAKDPQTSPQTSATNISEATIVIDAGHGGNDPGAIASNGTYEKSLTLDTAYILQRKLENAGANVIMTRSDDSFVSLNNRTVTSKTHGADAFISLHYDSNNNASASGTSTYYYSNQEKQLANTVNQYMNSYGQIGNNGVKRGNLHVLRENSTPSVLLELGFMTNSHDLAQIQTGSYQATIADAIYLGLTEYFS